MGRWPVDLFIQCLYIRFHYPGVGYSYTYNEKTELYQKDIVSSILTRSMNGMYLNSSSVFRVDCVFFLLLDDIVQRKGQ